RMHWSSLDGITSRYRCLASANSVVTLLLSSSALQVPPSFFVCFAVALFLSTASSITTEWSELSNTRWRFPSSDSNGEHQASQSDTLGTYLLVSSEFCPL